MSLNLDILIPYDQLVESPNDVLKLVDEHRQIVLLRNNKPAYIIMKADAAKEILKLNRLENPIKSNLTLHEAMKIVLTDIENNQMHAADLADEIYRRGLYFKKDGTKATYSQIRARCGHYDMFDALKGNIIKLKTTDSNN